MVPGGESGGRRGAGSSRRPRYPDLARSGELDERVERALGELEHCRCCPRACGVDRTSRSHPACGIGRRARVTSAFPHLGEEDCLRGWRGSGTIFFAGCNLRCVFCQNWDISQSRRAGQEMDAGQLAGLMLGLQRAGCHNINLVTPEHVVPQVLHAVLVAARAGLELPLVYNTSAYDSVDSLRLLDGVIDIYMPDFKFWRPDTAARLALARDYPEVARRAILEMHRQAGPLELDADGLARRGVLVRHLVMPGQLDESREIFRWLAEAVSPDTYVNIMGQYRPEHRVLRARARSSQRFAEIDRRPRADELASAWRVAHDAGLWRFDVRRRAV